MFSFRRAAVATLIIMSFAILVHAEAGEADTSAFHFPEGYSLTVVQDSSWEIWDEAGTFLGGITFTELTPEDLLADPYDTQAFTSYIQSLAHKNEATDYFAWVAGVDGHPMRYVNLSFTNRDTMEKRESYHVIFVQNGLVYDMWFDTAQISASDITSLLYLAKKEQPFPFRLPEGFAFAEESETTCTIVNSEYDDIGGIQITDLPLQALQAEGVSQYLSCESNFISQERFILNAHDRIFDPKIQEEYERLHLFFAHDEKVYDMWFNLSMVSYSEIASFSCIF